MRSRVLLRCAVAALLTVAARPADADIFNFNILLDGDQAGITTNGNGMGTATYDDSTGDISWDISFQDLTGTINNAHFHGPAPPGTPAGVRLGTPFTAGVTAGNIVGSSNISAAFGNELISGLWYHNIHTTFAGGGEIRGQVLLIPEPATAAIGVTGLVALSIGLRRRRRRE